MIDTSFHSWCPSPKSVGLLDKALVYPRLLSTEVHEFFGRRLIIADLHSRARPVFLSPHRDDACFSLGATALRLKSGILINLFTESQYVADPSGCSDSRDEAAVTKLRGEEDRRFCELCGLQRIDLGLEEPPLKGRKPFDLAGVDDDRAALKRPLLDCLSTVASAEAQDVRLILFCPAGIGGHANHIATLLTVAEAMPILERRFRIFFYEDLHYASSGSKRRSGLVRLLSAMEGRHPIRHSIPLSPADAQAKLEAIHLYRSQFVELPKNLRRFTPKTWLPMAPHEAVWEFTK